MQIFLPIQPFIILSECFCISKASMILRSLWDLMLLCSIFQLMGHCNITYIGETGRTVGSRIKEHLRMKKQTVFVHLKSHSDNPFEECPISWKILHSNIKSHSKRKIIEALEIQKHSDNIMNGCIGRNICI